jgi:two-component system phosphate regulon response regulator OmpR
MAIHHAGRQPMAHILLVEDDADVQSIVSEFLVTLGHRLTCASSAEEARLFLASEPVDLALVDCLMSGEQGNSLAQHASRLGIPTILTSGDPHSIETSSDHPFPFLAKPFRLTSLDELIARTLRRPGTDLSR